VAGIIAAEHSETEVTDSAVLGIAPEAQILPIKFIGTSGGTLSAAIRSMDYAKERGAKVINASWGGTGCSQILRDKIIELGRSGILFVTAAGNSGRNIDLLPEYPAAYTETLQITVGAISPFLGMTNFSNYSRNRVHLFAPGQSIISTVSGGGYASMSGTSMAAPFVAGAAAALLSARPDMSLIELREQLLKSTEFNANYSNITQGRMVLHNTAKSL
jgi:subtilisin family serine protease